MELRLLIRWPVSGESILHCLAGPSVITGALKVGESEGDRTMGMVREL